MPSPEAFPHVNIAAIDSCASDLKNVSEAASVTSTDISALQKAVAGSEVWQGEAASRWQTVMSGRAADGNLTSEVLGKAASLLEKLAEELGQEQRYYNKVSAELGGAQTAYNPRFNPEPIAQEDGYVTAMNGAVSRANSLLEQAGNDFLALAALAEDIGAKGAKNRMPGVPSGTNRNAASLNLLAFLMGTVLGNTGAGVTYEDTVLSELGLPGNNAIFRPNPAFEGKLTPTGLARGVIPDSETPNGIFEIKDVTSVQGRFQIRLETEYARITGRPLWVIAKGGAKVDNSVVDNAQSTGGGVIYRNGPNDYVDGQGNPVKISSNGTVTGYNPTQTGGSGSASGAPSAPSEPVNPNPAGQAPGSGSDGGDGGDGSDGGGDPVGPGDGDPVIDPIP